MHHPSLDDLAGAKGQKDVIYIASSRQMHVKGRCIVSTVSMPYYSVCHKVACRPYQDETANTITANIISQASDTEDIIRPL